MNFSQTIRPGAGFRAFFIFFAVFCFLPISLEAQQGWNIIWGTNKGLYRKNQSRPVETLWSGGKVQKIISWDKGVVAAGWALLTDQGIVVSKDLKVWEQRNNGLPERVIKIYEDGEKKLITAVREIKDLSVNPENPEIMVCAFKDAVYLSRNGGLNWENLGMPNYRSNGIKATAVAVLEGELTVFCSHSIYGVYYFKADEKNAKWIEVSAGLEKLETTNNSDEISGIAIVPGSAGPEIYASQSFRRRLYKLNWQLKTWDQLWTDEAEFGPTDSLSAGRNSLRLVCDGEILEIGYSSLKNWTPSSGRLQAVKKPDLLRVVRGISGNDRPNCVLLRENRTNAEAIHLSELWLLDPPKLENRTAKTAGKNGIYLPVNHAMDDQSLKPYLDIIEKRNLNMVVIDMKDDYGRLRFTPQNPSMTNLGRVFRPVDIDKFLKTMKDKGIFTVARIVVFKDPEAARKDGEKYAVWDKNNKAWEGYFDVRRKKAPPGEEPETNTWQVTEILPSNDPDYEILRTWYDEKWVDPYSEIIWDYNASVAEELCRRGFDEIQFDYIRFPTDGVNLDDARYRWRDSGMDMDSAILSFLRHVRSRVSAPISVDIYGANGWYRTGARTGQEVEMLASWVDVICPMYYPSHFEQTFLAHDPPELRPWRIYNHGTQRTRIIARGRVIVRPWAQAFYLNVSYDRKYYNTDYVRLQAEGVRTAGNGGLTYWNNSGRYDDIPQ